MTLLETIKTNRPNITHSSANTYASIIRNLSKNINIDIETVDDIKKHITTILEKVLSYSLTRRKNNLAALVVLSDDKSNKNEGLLTKLRAYMMKDIKEQEENDKTQTLNEKEKENWLHPDEIKRIYTKLEKSVSHLIKDTNPLNKGDFQRLQDYVLLSILTLIPPSRSSDLTNIKIKDIDPNNDNYKKANKLIINKYKTAKTYGKREIELPAKLNKILQMWIEKNPFDYMFVNKREKQMNPTQLMGRLYDLFDKNISTTMLRKIFVTERLLKDMPDLEQLNNIAENAMGHSLITSMTKYKKKLK